MKASAGKPKVLMLAFGHPDNVLSLCKAVSWHVHVELVFVVAEDRFRQGILDIDITSMPYGLNSYDSSKQFLPAEISEFIGSSFNIRFLRTPSRKLLGKSGCINLKIVQSAAISLKKEKHQAVHYNGASGFIGLFRLILRGGIKNIWTIHDYIPHRGEANPKGDFVQRITMLLGFEYIQHYQWLRERFIEHYRINSRKVHQVYSGAFNIFNHFDAKKNAEIQDHVLFFGRISPYKGIDTLLKAYLKLKKEYPQLAVKLCIAGSGSIWFDDSLLKHPDIMFINRYIQTNELVYLIKSCRYIVLPYTDSTHSAVVMTAYAFNKPVVAANVGGLHEVVLHGKTGFLCERDRVDELSAAMYPLMADDGLLVEMSDNIERFKNEGVISWEKVATRMSILYQSYNG